MVSCDTCDHTMHGHSAGWFWCPVCGALRNPEGRHIEALLVSRAQKVLRQIADGPEDSGTLAVTYLREACLPPDQRG